MRTPKIPDSCLKNNKASVYAFCGTLSAALAEFTRKHKDLERSQEGWEHLFDEFLKTYKY